MSGNVVMIHGAGGGGWEFLFWRRVFLRRGFSCFAPTLIPHPAGIAATRLSDYMDQVAEMSSGMAVDCLIGASLGGTIALSLLDVIRPKRLVLINSVLPAPLQPLSEPPWPEIIRWRNGTVEDSKAAMPGSAEGVVRAASRRWRDESGPVLLEASTRIQCLKIQVPHLMVISGADSSVPAASSLAWAKVSRAAVRYYAGLSHVDPLLGMQARSIARDAMCWAMAGSIAG